MRLKKLAPAALGACLIAFGPLSVVAQAPDTEGPVGTGGRVEVSAADYALSLPDDWLHIQPTGNDIGSIIDITDGMLPELTPAIEAAFAGGLGFSLLAFSGDPDAGFAENCNVLDRASDGASLEQVAAAELAQLESFREILASGPELSYVELPAGRAARLDLGLTLPEFETASTSYLFTDGTWVHTLTCTDLERPADGWLRVASGFEFLPLGT